MPHVARVTPELLEGLNPEQEAAVVHPGGPVLVVAGAGSGKTRVLTHRIAHLVRDRDVAPHRLLAITFTNKAADEMRIRVGALVGDRLVGVTRGADGSVSLRRWGGMWVSTFHSACARILRSEAPRLGYDSSYTIYDAADSRRVVAQCADELGVDTKRVTARGIAAEISRAKNELVDFDTYRQRAQGWYEQQVAEVYTAYQARLRRASAFDFDDLLVTTVELLQLFDDVRDHWRERFRHVLVDEWQDTNRAQYELVRILAEGHRQVMVVGDTDQGIYGFRGADVRNVMAFERDFPDTTRITLDRNYRSTQTILDAANAVIANNVQRLPKRLWTDAGIGEPVVRYTAEHGEDEAAFIAEEVTRLTQDDGIRPGDCAVFYRTNAQSRVLEEVLVRIGMPYQIVGGTRFYERAEVRDLLAYLRLLANPADDVSARRVVNVPRRGVGARTQQALAAYAARSDLSFLEACRRADRIDALGARARSAVAEFVAVVDDLAAVVADAAPLPDIVEAVWTRTGYLDELEAERTVEAEGRAENVRELGGVAADFADASPGASLVDLLERVALITEGDDLVDSETRITMMTVHNAKGLEFPVVFVAGLEDGVFPHQRTLAEPDDLEEERRLCYVAMTRAQRRLYLTNARSRMLFGRTQSNPPSRFLWEMPAGLLEDRSGRGGAARRAAATLLSEGPDVAVGDRVRHRSFGAGRVLEVAGGSGRRELVVRFDQSGTKRLVAAYASLERV